jgi:tetratricopeptide (TPR) repeat protein
MASNRPPKPTKLFLTLDFIVRQVRANRRKLQKAMGIFSGVIGRISRDLYQVSEKKHRGMSEVEQLKIADTIEYMLNEFGYNKDLRRLGNPRVHLLEAKYYARRGHVEAAIGLYRDIEKHYPFFKAAYNSHARLLRSLGRDAQAERVEDRCNLISERQHLAKKVRAPGYGRFDIFSQPRSNVTAEQGAASSPQLSYVEVLTMTILNK